MTILFGGGDPIKCEPILGSGSHGWSHEFSEDGNWEPLILRDITTSLQEFGPTWSLSKNDAKNIKKLQIPPIQSWIIQKYWAQACDMCPVSIFLFEFCHNPRLPTAGVLSPPQSHLELPREVGSGTCPGVCRVFLGPKDYCLEQVKMRCTTNLTLQSLQHDIWIYLVYQIIILAPDPSSTCSVLALASSESMSSQQT